MSKIFSSLKAKFAAKFSPKQKKKGGKTESLPIPNIEIITPGRNTVGTREESRYGSAEPQIQLKFDFERPDYTPASLGQYFGPGSDLNLEPSPTLTVIPLKLNIGCPTEPLERYLDEGNDPNTILSPHFTEIQTEAKVKVGHPPLFPEYFRDETNTPSLTSNSTLSEPPEVKTQPRPVFVESRNDETDRPNPTVPEPPEVESHSKPLFPGGCDDEPEAQNPTIPESRELKSQPMPVFLGYSNDEPEILAPTLSESPEFDIRNPPAFLENRRDAENPPVQPNGRVHLPSLDEKMKRRYIHFVLKDSEYGRSMDENNLDKVWNLAQTWKGGDGLALSLMTYNEVCKGFGWTRFPGVVFHQSGKNEKWELSFMKYEEVCTEFAWTELPAIVFHQSRKTEGWAERYKKFQEFYGFEEWWEQKSIGVYIKPKTR